MSFSGPFMFAAAADTAGTTASPTSAITSLLITFLPVIIIFYFFIIRPQKKRDKEDKEIRESIVIGDEVVTIGGIIGIVVRQTDDSLVIETGGDRSKIRVQKIAIKDNITGAERRQAEVAAAKAEKLSSIKTSASSDSTEVSDKKKKK